MSVGTPTSEEGPGQRMLPSFPRPDVHAAVCRHLGFPAPGTVKAQSLALPCTVRGGLATVYAKLVYGHCSLFISPFQELSFHNSLNLQGQAKEHKVLGDTD